MINTSPRVVRVSFDGRPGRIGLESDPYPTRLSNLLTCLASGLAAVGALRLIGASDSTWGLATSLLIVLACCAAGLLTLVHPHAFTPGLVRIEIDHAPRRLSFRSLTAVVVDWFAFALIMLWATAAAALVLIRFEMTGDGFPLGQVPGSVFVALGLGVFAIAHLVHRLRQESQVRSGLHLTPGTISCAGGGDTGTVEWRLLHRVAIEKRSFGVPHLLLLDDDRKPLAAVSVRYLGSDPMVIAAFLHYFRDRPEERELLSDPERAIARFGQHLARLEAADREQTTAEPSAY